jgi:hypothetical protein
LAEFNFHRFDVWADLESPLAEYIITKLPKHATHYPTEMHEDQITFTHQYIVRCSCGEILRITAEELISYVPVRKR